MRIGWVVVGVVVLLIGAVMLFVPLEPQPNQTVTTTSSPYYEASVSGFSLTGNIPVAISWSTSGNTSVDVVGGACTSSSNCANSTSASDITTQSGTSGSFTINQPNGGSFLVGVVTTGSSAASVTFKITTALTTIGTILVIVGILLLIVGIVLRKKSKAAAAPGPAPAMPSTEPADTPPPT